MATLSNIWERTSSARRHIQQFCDSTLAGPESAPTSIIDSGDFHIDLDSRMARVRDRELHLTWAEFDVLVYLLSHTRRVTTSATRLTTRTEEGETRQTEFLPALLSLRKKLREEVPGAQYVQAESWLLYDFHPQLAVSDPRTQAK